MPLLLKADGGGYGQPGGEVVCAAPAQCVLHIVARETLAFGAAAPRDDKRLHQRLDVCAHVQEARALGRAEPFVAVAGVEIGVKRVEVERNLAGGVCAVDHRIDAGGAGARQQGLNGQAQRRGRGDVAEK